jgi:hypothetical protein
MMDGFDNDYSDSDDCKTNDGEETLHMCKECGAEFDFSAKGVSRLKELCSKCHGSAIDFLLADGIGPYTATAHASGVAEKVATMLMQKNCSSALFVILSTNWLCFLGPQTRMSTAILSQMDLIHLKLLSEVVSFQRE